MNKLLISLLIIPAFFFFSHYYNAYKYLNTTVKMKKQQKEKHILKWNDIIRFTVDGNPEPDKRVEKSDEEWKRLLTAEQYRITRLKGTERPGTGEYCSIHEPGVYCCVCCGTLLFDSSIKFESGTGWPSFTQPVKENAVKYKKDTSYGMMRVEVLCNTCDAHLGHVFPDGPKPGGLRYCINSAAIKLLTKSGE